MSTQQRTRQGGFPLPKPGPLSTWMAASSFRALWARTSVPRGDGSDKEPEIKRPAQWGKATSQSQTQTQSKKTPPKPQGTGAWLNCYRETMSLRDRWWGHLPRLPGISDGSSGFRLQEKGPQEAKHFKAATFFSWWGPFFFLLRDTCVLSLKACMTRVACNS